MMLRLVTYYTPSHEQMCREFVLSRVVGFDKIHSTQCEQTCPSGVFKSHGWNECMLDKLRCLMALPQDGMPTVYVDSDVALMNGFSEFCKEIFESLPDNGIAFSNDIIQLSAGIMFFRSTEVVQGFWRLVAELSPILNLQDQDVINNLFDESKTGKFILPIVPSVLPSDKVCNWATINTPNPPSLWDGEPFEVPQSCVAWHANWTLGIENKMRMLNRVINPN